MAVWSWHDDESQHADKEEHDWRLENKASYAALFNRIQKLDPAIEVEDFLDDFYFLALVYASPPPAVVSPIVYAKFAETILPLLRFVIEQKPETFGAGLLLLLRRAGNTFDHPVLDKFAADVVERVVELIGSRAAETSEEEIVNDLMVHAQNFEDLLRVYAGKDLGSFEANHKLGETLRSIQEILNKRIVCPFMNEKTKRPCETPGKLLHLYREGAPNGVWAIYHLIDGSKSYHGFVAAVPSGLKICDPPPDKRRGPRQKKN